MCHKLKHEIINSNKCPHIYVCQEHASVISYQVVSIMSGKKYKCKMIHYFTIRYFTVRSISSYDLTLDESKDRRVNVVAREMDTRPQDYIASLTLR